MMSALALQVTMKWWTDFQFYFLGIKDWQSFVDSLMSQLNYATKILNLYGKIYGKLKVSPTKPKHKLSHEDLSLIVDITKYKQLIGRPIFLCNTRIDIWFVVCVVSRFYIKLKEMTLLVLKYIAGIVSD